MDPLTTAVVEAERHAAGKGWGQAPHLYALAKKEALTLSRELAAQLSDAPDGSLIPIEQDPLREGEPAEVLASVHWPSEVAGCVLVTEIIVLPPRAEEEAPSEPAAAEQWAAGHPDGHQGRLAVGVLRDGQYSCCLQLRNEEALQVGTEIADDLVAALLGTF